MTAKAHNADKPKAGYKPGGGKGKPRPLRRDALVQRANQVLLTWSNRSPQTHPINLSTLSRELNVSRQALYDNGIDKEIPRYKEAQRKNFSSKQSTPKRKSCEERLAELEDKLTGAQQKLDAWIERWAAVEYNSRMLGINPDEIFAALPNPDRARYTRGFKSRRRTRR